MRKYILLLIAISLTSEGFSQAFRFNLFESETSINYMLSIYSAEYRDVYFYKFSDSTNLIENNVMAWYETKPIIDIQNQHLNRLDSIQRKDILNILKDTLAYAMNMLDDKGNTTGYFCIDTPSVYKYYFVFYINNEVFTELILSPGTRKYSFRSVNRNVKFTINESCINSKYWTYIDAFVNRFASRRW
jgi:hypothetical protein